ncbi:hypothetical protein [Kribbella sp. VKM Ac-2566]|uniref:hypothetical protein n=1 Tax=Kribbella sp. VKM Ac-2566 TaxID=2512218 RepID=UPI001063EBBB|nr:hypothetical protein [Kribbella sp. VKM Ac-2566]TDX08499.1 hypothetical protein EV647_0424 [Kribbella sp. VKM Ac-2566]
MPLRRQRPPKPPAHPQLQQQKPHSLAPRLLELWLLELRLLGLRLLAPRLVEQRLLAPRLVKQRLLTPR